MTNRYTFKQFLKEHSLNLSEKNIKSYFNNDKFMVAVFNLETLKIVEEKYYKELGNITLVFDNKPFNDRDDLELEGIFDCEENDIEIEFKDDTWFKMLDYCVEYFNNGLTKNIKSSKNNSTRTPLPKGRWDEVEEKYSHALLIYDPEQFYDSVKERGKRDYKNMTVDEVGFREEIWISGVDVYDLLMKNDVEGIFERALETLIDDYEN